jgi:hypothetical protein
LTRYRQQRPGVVSPWSRTSRGHGHGVDRLDPTVSADVLLLNSNDGGVSTIARPSLRPVSPRWEEPQVSPSPNMGDERRTSREAPTPHLLGHAGQRPVGKLPSEPARSHTTAAATSWTRSLRRPPQHGVLSLFGCCTGLGPWAGSVSSAGLGDVAAERAAREFVRLQHRWPGETVWRRSGHAYETATPAR